MKIKIRVTKSDIKKAIKEYAQRVKTMGEKRATYCHCCPIYQAAIRAGIKNPDVRIGDIALGRRGIAIDLPRQATIITRLEHERWAGIKPLSFTIDVPKKYVRK